MRASENTIYLSDYFTVPMPQKASSHQDYLKKIKNRRILWALLPYLFEAMGILIVLVLTIVGITICGLGLGLGS